MLCRGKEREVWTFGEKNQFSEIEFILLTEIFLVFDVDQLLETIFIRHEQIQGSFAFVFRFVDEIHQGFGFVRVEVILFDFIFENFLHNGQLIIGVDDDEIIR